MVQEIYTKFVKYRKSFHLGKETLGLDPMSTVRLWIFRTRINTSTSVNVPGTLPRSLSHKPTLAIVACLCKPPASDDEINYPTTEKECLAVIWGVRKLRYLEGYDFEVTTDHLSLKWLNKIENPTGRLVRWALELQQHKFIVKYRKGKWNKVTDALSRQPLETCQIAKNDVTSTEECHSIKRKLQEIRERSEKFPECSFANSQLYRHFPPHLNDNRIEPRSSNRRLSRYKKNYMHNNPKILLARHA